jgi:hypothetical protein
MKRGEYSGAAKMEPLEVMRLAAFATRPGEPWVRKQSQPE